MQTLESLMYLKSLLTQFLAQFLIPNFKKTNKLRYKEMLNKLAQGEVNNSRTGLDFWRKMNNAKLND